MAEAAEAAEVKALQNSKFIYQKPVQFRVFFWLLILSFSLFLDLGREGECRVIVLMDAIAITRPLVTQTRTKNL